MRAVVYEVTAFVDNASLRDAFLDWLGSGHVQAVLDGGARNAMVTVYPKERGWAVEARFTFPSHALFDAYESGPAVAIRDELKRRFEDAHGLRVERQVGQMAFRLP